MKYKKSLIDQNQLESKIDSLRNKIKNINNDILRKFPVEIYLKEARSSPPYKGYEYVSLMIANMFSQIASNYDKHVLNIYHKLCLSITLKYGFENLKKTDFPACITDLYNQWFERVFEDLSKQPDQYYDHMKDEFLKDLGVCSFKAIPVGGSWVAQIQKIRKTLLFSGGIYQLFELLYFSLLKMGGFSPFYGLHIATRYINYFTPEGRDLAYINLAKLLKIHPRIRGMVGESWFNDPKLEGVSPRLAYLRQRPVQNGAKTFRCGTSEYDIKMAIAKSPTRRKLFEEGKYLPASYNLIWPRKELIEWADKQLEIQ